MGTFIAQVILSTDTDPVGLGSRRAGGCEEEEGAGGAERKARGGAEHEPAQGRAALCVSSRAINELQGKGRAGEFPWTQRGKGIRRKCSKNMEMNNFCSF